MMGPQGGVQNQLFYSFNLEDHVPSGHLLRGIDQFFDLGDLRDHLAPFYSLRCRSDAGLDGRAKRSGVRWCPANDDSSAIYS